MTVTVHAYRSTALAPAPVWHAGRRAAVVDVDGDLTLEACVVPWDTPARVTDDGRHFYTETWHPGSLTPGDRVVIYDGHFPGGGGPGRLNPDRHRSAADAHQRPDGLYRRASGQQARGRTSTTGPVLVCLCSWRPRSPPERPAPWPARAAQPCR